LSENVKTRAHDADTSFVDTQLSPQIRLIAIAGAVLAVAGGGFMFMMNRAAAAEEEPIPVASSMLPNPAKAPAPKKAAAPAKAAKPAAKKAAATKPAAKKAAAPKPAPAPEPVPEPEPLPAVADNGLPMSVAVALQRHEVVVVSLFTPGASVDELALAEARAGAKSAKVGFVALNVLNQDQGGAVARLVGVTEPPAVLIYRSPGTLAFQFDGFADLDTVAQAATSAKP
jgi:outer membrane biosynthesis protein TonB